MGVGLRLSQSRGLVSIPVTPGTRVRAVPSSRPAQTPTATLARTGPRPARERWGTGPGFTRRLRVFRLGHSEGKSGPQFPRAPSGRGMGQCGRSPQTGTTAATTFTAAAARPGAKGDQLSEKGACRGGTLKGPGAVLTGSTVTGRCWPPARAGLPACGPRPSVL